MNYGTEIELEKTFEAWDKPDFEEVLIDELLMKSFDIPLQDYCIEGGWPDDESFQFEVKKTEEKRGCRHIQLNCKFTEVVPSSCADFNTLNKCFATLIVILDPEAQTAFFQR